MYEWGKYNDSDDDKYDNYDDDDDDNEYDNNDEQDIDNNGMDQDGKTLEDIGGDDANQSKMTTTSNKTLFSLKHRKAHGSINLRRPLEGDAYIEAQKSNNLLESKLYQTTINHISKKYCICA